MSEQAARSDSTPVHYVVWESMPGGMESYITHYSRYFQRKKDIYVFSLRPSENGLTDPSEAHFEQGSDNNWECYRRFFRYARKYRRDTFHLMNGGPVILSLLLLAGVRNPVYHIHGTKYWKTWKDRIFLMTAWRLASLFKVRYIANSQYSARIFERDVLPITPEVVYNGFELSRFMEKRRLRTHLQRMGYVGRLDNGKNTHLVIRLFEEVAGEYPDLELHIAGIGSQEKSLRQQAAQSPFAGRIFFHGWIRDVAGFYQSLDLLVFLSAYESFGNILAEALLTGLPILTSDIPVFQEIHGGEPAFCLGDPSQFEVVRSNFLKALTDYPGLARKAFAATPRIQQLFDIEKHLHLIEQSYLPSPSKKQ